MSNILDPRITFLGNSSIGIFGLSTDRYTLVPNGLKSTVLNTIKQHLKTDVVISSISNSHLNGIFSVGNSNHLLLPGLVSEDEFNRINEQLPSDVSVHVLQSKITALGNTIICSDKAALVSNEFPNSQKKLIAEYLDVEVIDTKQFMSSSLIGSMIFLSNQGFLTHPLFEDEDIQWLSDYFSIQGNVVTVNRGMPYPRLGIIANSNGTLVGSDTTGPEILRISEILGTL